MNERHLNEEDYLYLRSQPLILNHNYKVTHVQKLDLYSIYNRLTGKQENPNVGCGRCFYNIRERLKLAVNKYPKQI